MSLQEVERASRDIEDAREALRIACIRAAEAGVPHAAIARAAKVARNTVRAWVTAGR